MNKSEKLKPERKIKFKCFLLANILTLFFVMAAIASAAGNSFNFNQESVYSEPFSKLIEFLNDKKNELENYDGDFLSAKTFSSGADSANEINSAVSSFASSVFESVKGFVVDSPKQYLGTVFESVKSFIFPGKNQNNFEYKSPSNEENAKEIENLKQQYEEAINEASVLSQKFNLLQTELGKIKDSGVVVRQPIIEQKVVERTIERIISGSSAIPILSQNELDSKISEVRTELNNLNTNLLNQINALSASSNRQTSAVYQAVSLTNKIDSLSGTRLTNVTVNGVSGLTDSDIPDGITVSNYLSLAGGTLTGNILMPASAYLNFGTDSGSSGYGVRDNSGTMQFKNSGGSWTAIAPSQWGNNGSSIYYNDGNIGIGTTSPYAKLSIVGETVSSYFTATSSTKSTFPYASTTALTVSGSAYIGSLNGPLQANNGLVSATTSVGTVYGGTGINSSALTGLAQIVSGTWSASSTLSTAFGGTGWGNLQANTVLLGNDAGRIATTSAGTDGYVLALSSGVPTWIATSTLSTITGTLAVGKGGTGQTSFGQGWLNSNGTDLSASTSPTVNYIVATSTTATSTFPYLSVATNSNLGTVVGGTWQGTAVGDAYLTKSGDWTGTLDTYEASSLLARANHTGTQGVSTLSNYDWTFSNNYGALNLTGTSTKPIWAQGGINASSTSNFVYASTTALTISGTAYIGSLNGPLQANNGLLSATTSVGSTYGGTGLNSSALTGLAQIVSGTWSASSTLSTAFGGTGWGNLQANTVLLGNGAGRIATTSAGTDGYVLALSAGVPTWLATSTLSTITGTLAVGKGGTGQTSFGQGWLNSNGTDLSASTSPTVNYLTATSTTATSTFPYLSVATNSNLGTVVGGTWQGTAVGDAYLTKSGDWTGTLDTYEASSLLARANHTGTQGVSTLSNYDWTFSNNYGAINLTGTSTKPIWAQGGINASSTSNFVYASTTALTVSGNSYLGTVSSGAWNGTAITDPYISSAASWNNKWDLASSTIPVSKGGTGLTSGYNNTNWDTAYTNRITSATYPLSISSNNMSLAFGTTTSNTWAGTQTFTNASTTQIGSTGSAYFATGGGNVGIGTTSPGSRLSVSGGQSIGANYGVAAPTNGLIVEGNVGIGTTTPGTKLDVVGGNVRIFNNGSNATLKIGDTMSNSDDSGDNARLTWDSAEDRFSIGTWDGGLNTLVINKSGNVGIGTTTPAAKLDVSGSGNINVAIDATGGNGAGIYFKSSGRDTWQIGNSIAVASRFDVTDTSTGNTGVYISSGATSWTSNSDVRLKTNIANISNTLEKLKRIRGITFNWIDPKANQATQVGVIAQEVESVFPEIVDTQSEYWGIQYDKLSPILVEAVNELNAKVDLFASSTIYSSYLVTPTSTPAMLIDSFGNVGIGTTSPAYKLQVMGDIAATSFINTSTKTAKKDITYLSSFQEEDFLDKIKNTNLANYHYNIESGNNPLRLGLIAEEAPAEILSVDGKGVDVYKMATFTLGGVKALQKEIEKMKIDLMALSASAAASGGTGSDGLFAWITEKFKTVLGITFENEKVKVKNLCVGETCVTEEQFKAVFGNSQPASSASSSSSSSASSSSQAISETSSSSVASEASSSSEISSSSSSSEASSLEIASSSSSSNETISSSSFDSSVGSSNLEASSASSEPSP